jgi:hypothetical protein
MENMKPKPYVFVLMPFAESFDDVYELGIKTACSDAGAYCERVDEQIFDGTILERIYNQIAKADVVVSDMSERNPNVFYETGYAHALGKRVILLTQKTEDIPFDLKHYPHIVYEGKITKLKTQLEMRVRWCIENPQIHLSAVDVDIEFFVNGNALITAPTVSVVYDSISNYITLSGRGGKRGILKIDLHNRTRTLVKPGSFSLGLVLPNDFFESTGDIASFSVLPDERIMCNLQLIQPLFPDGWHSFSIHLFLNPKELSDSPLNALLRLFTEVGSKDYPFNIEIYGS